MSGKFESNRDPRRKRAAKPFSKKKGKGNPLLYILIAVLATVLVVLLVYAPSLEVYDNPDIPTVPTVTDPTEDIRIDVDPETEFDLGRGLVITDVGSYTGVYMEDGSDEIVSRVLMAVVTNQSDQDLEYAEIILTGGDKEAKFTVSTLPAGTSAVLLEKSRMEFPGEDVFTGAQTNLVSFFNVPVSLHDDVLKLQGLDGALNIANISDSDITGDIVIYYKNSSSDMYYGGITYRVRLEGGLKAGEIRQIMSGHYSPSGSEIMFVTYTQ